MLVNKESEILDALQDLRLIFNHVSLDSLNDRQCLLDLIAGLLVFGLSIRVVLLRLRYQVLMSNWSLRPGRALCCLRSIRTQGEASTKELTDLLRT